MLVAAAIIGLSSGAYAADLGVPEPDTTGPWAGPYVGGSIGYGPGTFTFDDCTVNYGICSFNFSGPFIGAQAGFNFYLDDHWLVGLEGDINWANETGTASSYLAVPDAIGTGTVHIDWTGAVTAHLGYSTDDYLLYVLAGFAAAHGSENFFTTGSEGGDYSGMGSGINGGFTVGAGIAKMLTDKISGFIEARYSQYASTPWDFTATTYGNSPDTESVSFNDFSVKVGLNLHLN